MEYMNRIRWYGPTLVLVVTVVAVMLVGPRVTQRLAYVQAAETIQVTRQSLEQSASLAELSAAFRKVGQVVEPSVVSIEVSTRRSQPSGRMDMRRFFPFDIPQDMQPGMPQQPEGENDDQQFEQFNTPQPYGSGSGWVYDVAGHIITNNHVIEGADLISVRFVDGSKRDAKLVAADPQTDIAVLKVEGNGLHPAVLAREPVEQGDIVFAFGSPFRFENSMSQGIVSAKGRELGILRRPGPGGAIAGYERFIQTDAAINPGNSGGPLTNIRGEVVGMNTAIATRTGAYNGLGFAIPVDMVRNVVEQILAQGRVVRGYLGVYIDDMDAKMARTFGFEGRGVLVRNPIPGSPAEKAGLKAGDIVTKVDDKVVETAEDLRFLVAEYRPGSKITLTIFREGKLQPLPVEVGEMPNETRAAAPGQAQPEAVADASVLLRKLGLERVVTVTPDMTARMPQAVPGVLVQGVRPRSAAAAANLSAGSVITDVQGQPVRTVEELIAALGKHDLTKGVRISVTEYDSRSRQHIPRFELLELPGE
jgi:serine protease Do